MKENEKIQQGKRSKRKGTDTENRVWHDLLQKGFIATKWQNNVDLENNKIIRAKPGRFKQASSGFPDYIYFPINDQVARQITALEVKSKGYLSRTEKDKCDWLLKNKIFNKIQVARRVKVKNRIQIIYEDYPLKRRKPVKKKIEKKSTKKASSKKSISSLFNDSHVP